MPTRGSKHIADSLIKRILVGSFAAGIVLFLWGCAAWLFLPVHSQFRDIGDEEAVRRTLMESIPDKGVYYFPKHPDKSPESLADWNEKVALGPTGILVFNPSGHGALGFRKFAGSFLANWVSAIIAAVLLTLVVRRRFPKGEGYVLSGHVAFRMRWLCVFLMGVLISVSAYAPDWIWYGYPAEYIFKDLSLKMIGGWALAGLVLAYFIRPEEEVIREARLEEKIKSEIREKLGSE